MGDPREILGKSVRITGTGGELIESLKGAIDVHPSDVHIEMPNRLFAHFPGTNTTTLSTRIQSGDTSIDIQAADYANFSVNDSIFIDDGCQQETAFQTITAKPASPTLVLDAPLDNTYETAPTIIQQVFTNIALGNGSISSPIIYKIQPPSEEIWHLTRLNLSAVSVSESSIDEFLSLPSLLNGCVLRKSIDGVITTYTNWKADRDFIDDFYDLNPVPKPPAGNFGQRGRWWLKRADVIIRLDGSKGDNLQILVQDNLTGSSLTSWQMKGQGHIEGDITGC